MRIYHFLFFIFFLAPLFSFEDKDLRQLYHTAELAMGKEDYGIAKEAYLKILEKTDPRPAPKKKTVDWPTYVDTILRLCQTHFHLQEYNEGEKQIDDLLSRHPPHEFLYPLYLFKARLLCCQSDSTQAYLLMQRAAALTSPEAWKGEDRSLFKGLEYLLNCRYEALESKAKRLQITGFYSEAKEIYSTLLDAIDKGYFPKAPSDSLLKKKICYRLAETSYQLAEFDKALSFLSPNEKPQDEWDREVIFLCALAHKEKCEYETALKHFTSYLNSGLSIELPHYIQALFEIGLFHFNRGNIALAKNHFETAIHAPVPKEKPFLLSLLYLAKIYLKENEPQLAEKILFEARDCFSPSDPLYHEWAFLRAESAFLVGEYASAADLYELSLPSQPLTGTWSHIIAYKLGWASLILGDDFLKSRSSRQDFFQKAHLLFTKLLQGEMHDYACLSLARLHLIEYEHFHQTCSLDALETLAKEHFSQLTQANAQQFLLLLAESKTSHLERELLYETATKEDYKESPYYADGWYLRGLNELFQGITQHPHFPDFDKALSYLEKARSLFQQKDDPLYSQCLLAEAKAYYYHHLPSLSLAQLNQLLRELPVYSSEREEVLYLHSLICAYMEEPWGIPSAKETLKLQLSQYPQGKYAASSLFLLGSLYFKENSYKSAQEFFLQLAEIFPDSLLAAEGWFWAAEASEKLGENPFSFRQNLIEKHPSSPFAEVACFRLFSLADYAKGSAESLKHLENYVHQYPFSPYLIPVCYFLALHEKEAFRAKTYFQKALSHFESLVQMDSVPPAFCTCFRYRTQLALARLEFTNSPSDEEKMHAINRLHALIDHLSSLLSPLSSPNQEEFLTLQSLYFESALQLAEYWKEEGMLSEARKVISQLFKDFENQGISNGYYFAKTWQLEGSLSLLLEDANTALYCFELAETSSQGQFGTEERLSNWIERSHCYKTKGEFDSAMRWLSKVINEDVISPLRLKAMLLRAEIYELQGRQELAIRQLEAVAKKGGDWALLAQEKLRRDYGME